MCHLGILSLKLTILPQETVLAHTWPTRACLWAPHVTKNLLITAQANPGKHRCLYWGNLSTLEMQRQLWSQVSSSGITPGVDHGVFRTSSGHCSFRGPKSEIQWQNHEMGCKFPLCFPMPAPAAISERGKHQKALAAWRKSPHPRCGDTARVGVSPLGGYCFTWKGFHVGRVLLRSFLGSLALILRDKILETLNRHRMSEVMKSQGETQNHQLWPVPLHPQSESGEQNDFMCHPHTAQWVCLQCCESLLVTQGQLCHGWGHHLPLDLTSVQDKHGFLFSSWIARSKETGVASQPDLHWPKLRALGGGGIIWRSVHIWCSRGPQGQGPAALRNSLDSKWMWRMQKPLPSQQP